MFQNNNTNRKNGTLGKKNVNENSEKSGEVHEGKLFIAQKGKAECDKGTKFPQFKVTSHHKLYLNDKEGNNAYLAVTENDREFNPSFAPFGNCSLKNGRPCSFAAAGNWQNFYTDVKVMGNSLLTEISELQCAVGGKIKIIDHGQQVALSKRNFKNANNRVHRHLNPVIGLTEFKNEMDEETLDAY